MAKQPQIIQGYNLDEHFEKAAANYEDQATMVKKFARDTIQLAPSISSNSVIHDNASGPGIVTGEILEQCGTDIRPEIYATDYSKAMIRMLQKKEWSSKVHSAEMDARDLKFANDKFTHSFTNFAIMAIPEPDKVAHEIYRTLQPGGTAIVTTIKYAGYLDIFNDAQKKVRPDLAPYPGPLPAEWLTDTKLRDVLISGGFQPSNVECRSLDAEMSTGNWAKGLEDMKTMLTTQMTKNWSDQETEEFKIVLKQQIEHEEMYPRPIRMVAWVAIARK